MLLLTALEIVMLSLALLTAIETLLLYLALKILMLSLVLLTAKKNRCYMYL